MTNKEAIDWINAIKEKYIYGGDERLDELRKEALDLAIKALEEHPTDKEIQDDMRRTYLGGKEE